MVLEVSSHFIGSVVIYVSGHLIIVIEMPAFAGVGVVDTSFVSVSFPIDIGNFFHFAFVQSVLVAINLYHRYEIFGDGHASHFCVFLNEKESLVKPYPLQALLPAVKVKEGGFGLKLGISIF